MSRRKEIALVTAGILAGIAVSGPAAQAAAGFMAKPSSQQFYLDDQRIALTAYEINGSNYVKLRDIGQAVDFGVTYDPATNTVHIAPDEPYVEEVNAAPSENSTLANGKAITEENVLELLRQVELEYPTGTAWGTHNTPGTHKNELPSTAANRIMDAYWVSEYYGCSGYAAMVSSMVFGDAANPGRQLDDLSQIRPGDILFLINNNSEKVWHVMIVLESPNGVNAFHYTDGNHGGAVYWPDRQNPYGRENLYCYGMDKSYRLEAWTRYPESVPCTLSLIHI